MSNPTPKPMTTTLILSASDRGGDGKTTSLVLIADYLASSGRTFAPVDCDTGNCGTAAGFSHWFNGPVDRLDLRSRDDCDALLQQSAQSGVEFILADLPANSSMDVAEWLQESATPEILQELGVRLLAICPVDQSSGAPESASAWMAALGSQADYLVMLNRKALVLRSRARPDVDTAFDGWHQWVKRGEVTQPYKTVEIGHLRDKAMQALSDLRELPHKAIRKPTFPILYRAQVQNWARNVHQQLEATGLFAKPSANNEAAA
jgi:hypothetical protein